MAQVPKVAGISGSLREGSYNTATLRAIREIAVDRLEIEIVTLHDIELFNADVEAAGWPQYVKALRERIEPAEAVLFATPEYNYSIPGVLKNAIDWLSRPEREGPIFNKPAVIVGATPSMVGTARAQAHLRQVAFYNGMPLLPTAEILIARAGGKFDDDGRLTDEKTRDFLNDMVGKFVVWIERHSRR
jgi:chromate reductase, NAD(P)H dehydrogenase (quinone)